MTIQVPNLPLQIGTNYIPSDEELDHIKNSILPVPTAKLADIDVEINRIQEIYSNLMEQRQALLAEIEGYQNLISPARRVPIDVLQEIFLHTLPTGHNALIDPHECPLLLTRICSGWRRIALSTPQLWSSIHVPVPPISRGHPRRIRFEDLTEEFRISSLFILKKYSASITNWLGRSGLSSLSISLYDSRRSTVPKEHYEIIIDSLLPFANRWKDLMLDTRSPFLGPIAELTESEVPMLESLTLHDIMTRNDDLNNVWKASGLVKSHRLKKIDYSEIEGNIMDFLFRWAQLTDIKLSSQAPSGWGDPIANATLSDLVTILSLAPRLTNCHFEIKLATNTGLTPPFSVSSLLLPNLQKLVFHDGGTNCAPLFELLKVPSLFHLEFFPTNQSSDTVLSTFLPQLAPTILSLTTSYSFFVGSNHYPVLSQCQKLTSITITSHVSWPNTWFPPLDFIKDIFLDNFTLPVGHSDRPAPALEVFECQIGGDFSDGAVLRFIKAKQSRPDIANLKWICINFTRPKEIDLSLDEEVAQYVADGLDVDLRYPVELNPKVPFAFRADAGVLPPNIQFGWQDTYPSDWVW